MANLDTLICMQHGPWYALSTLSRGTQIYIGFFFPDSNSSQIIKIVNKSKNKKKSKCIRAIKMNKWKRSNINILFKSKPLNPNFIGHELDIFEYFVTHILKFV